MVDEINNQNKKSLFSSTSPEANQVNLNDIGFDSSISQVNTLSQPANPKDFFQNTNDSVIKNIVDQKIETKNDNDSITNADNLLDEFAEIDKKLSLKIDSLESIRTKSKTSKLVLIIVGLIFALALVLSLYYQGRLSWNAEEIQTPLQQNQERLYNLQSQLLLNQSIKSSILLNQLAFQSSDFQRTYNQSISEFETDQSKSVARNSLTVLQAEIIDTLNELKSNLAQSQSIYNQSEEFKTIYTEFLSRQTESNQDYQGLSIFSPQQLARDSSLILRNNQITDLLQAQDLTTLTQADLLILLRELYSSINTNYLTDLANFTLNRIDLTRMFSELTTIARKFDSNFSPFNINPNSTINFNNYTITANNTIRVSADIKSTEQSLFSIIANLDDEISQSNIFEKLDRTSYSKTLNSDGQFTSNVSLDINIKQP